MPHPSSPWLNSPTPIFDQMDCGSLKHSIDFQARLEAHVLQCLTRQECHNVRSDVNRDLPQRSCGCDLLHDATKMIASTALGSTPGLECDVLATDADEVIG